VGTSVMNGLGQALRWLRERHSKKQYHVADDAGITKGMLSSYETGRQRPSLETLEKVLNTLGCDLHDLHNALQIVNGRPQIMRPRTAEADEAPEPQSGRTNVYKTLGISERLPPEEERAIAQILDGFHRLMRYLHQAQKGPGGPEEDKAGKDSKDEKDETNEKDGGEE
jgi:transcriptional regulator with XRE-family HTH domain